MAQIEVRRPIFLAYGTRPEAIKLAPIVKELAKSTSMHPVVAVSGQHREMLDQVNELFDIHPAHDLNLIEPGQSLTQVTIRALDGYSRLLQAAGAAAVVVQGDTTTTFAAALAAFYHRVPVVHVEAGLRTDNPYSPYPEEINRRLTTQVSALHLAPTELNRSNLLRDGVSEDVIRVTGNTVIDAFLDVAARQVPVGEPVIDAAIAARRRILLVTAHRRESWGEAMVGVGSAVAEIAGRFPELLVVLPVHRNPIVREQLLPPLAGLVNVVVTEPMSYAPFVTLIAASTVVLTDSGGLQEEAPSLGKPVLVMRDTTERPEAMHAGTAELVGTNPSRIVGRVEELLTNESKYAAMARAVNPYGDGHAARRSVAAIGALLGIGEPLADFVADQGPSSAKLTF